MKKGLFGLFMALVLVLTACGSTKEEAPDNKKGEKAGEAGKPTELVISTWGFAEDFFRKELYKPFEERNNVKIVLEIGNNGERLSKIQQGSSKVDLIYLSDYYAQQGIKADLFEKIDRSNIPNIEEIYDAAKAPLGEDYGPAYTIGQLGIVYNPKETDLKITSWKDLWNPELAKKITIPGITTTSGPMFLDAASRVAGHETFNEDAAFEKLKEINPNIVKEYGKTSEFVNMFAQGEIAAGPTWKCMLEIFVKPFLMRFSLHLKKVRMQS